MIELVCPCCDKFGEFSDEHEVASWRLERGGYGSDVLCSDCWNVFLKVARRLKDTKEQRQKN